ncbi:DUF4358 domain-containing protein [Allofournierella sp.]|uniref:DUF4358 domain-containing protein n=1 Tax=Allofournierella sp. TaxID=1940256 RepID=UPI003AB4740E
MKRFIAFSLTLCLALGLAACGGAPAGSGAPKDYAAALSTARPSADNDAYPVFTLKDGAWGASGAYAADLSEEDLQTQASLALQSLGLAAEDVQEAAFSLSLMNVQAYGVAIVMPAQNRTGAVKEALQAYIDGQKAAQQNYLPDQYAIAKAARLETLKTGEVVLVMRDGQNDVYSAIEKALK